MGWSDAFRFRDCPWCGLRHAQMVVSNFNVEGSAAGRLPRYWAFMTCPSCGGAISVETNAPHESPASEVLVSPQPGEHEVEVGHLPEDVERYYEGAVKVLRAGVPDAAAVQLRRTLEAAAAHFKIEERTLVKSTQKMIEQGLVTASFADVLSHVRLIGNQGAHATDAVLTDEQVSQALRFTTQLLRNLFEVPAELDALRTGDDADGADE